MSTTSPSLAPPPPAIGERPAWLPAVADRRTARRPVLPVRSLPAAPRPTPVWVTAVTAVVIAVAACGVLLGYHPPRAVVRAGPPIDVMSDITVTGRQPPPHKGRFLLLWVRTTRPNLAEFLVASARREKVVPTHRYEPAPADRPAERAAGRRQYLDSQKAAVAAAEAAAGV